MNTKMAAIFLTLMLALGVTGLAAAWWTDELKITGTVTTGTFGWELTLDGCGISGDDKEIIGAGVWLGDYVNGYAKSLNFYADDMYPCTDLWIIWDIHFYGSVPGHIYEVTVEAYEDETPLTEIPDYVFLYCEVQEVSDGLALQGITIGEWNICEFLDALESTQWHYSDYIVVFWYLHLVEEGMEINGYIVPDGVEVPMDTTLTVTVTINGIQYNAP